eukprot:5337747-Prorocentrum_lima.AAC.1
MATGQHKSNIVMLAITPHNIDLRLANSPQYGSASSNWVSLALSFLELAFLLIAGCKRFKLCRRWEWAAPCNSLID